MKYSLAIFDMDGTILNTLDDMTDSLNVILEKYKLPLHTLDEVRFMVGNGIPKLIERAIEGGRENPDFDKILKDFIIKGIAALRCRWQKKQARNFRSGRKTQGTA